MNLILDIGNTRSKMALFDTQSHELLEKKVETEPCSIFLIKNFIKKNKITGAILTNSGEVSDEVLHWLKENIAFFIHLSNDTPVPIQNLYGTPHTLGKDRLAAAVGATSIFPKKNCLVIDCGTCLTYNLVSDSPAFLGGNITPGVTIRLRAMHEFTARLPLIERGEITETWIGANTETALRNGAQLGALNEMQGFIDHFIQRFGDLETLLTGGDADFFVKYIKRKIFAAPNLVLIGLNTILNYNNQQKK